MLTVQENAEQADVNNDNLEMLFTQAIAHHQAEEWQAAEDCYRKVLTIMPEQPSVNYNLGMLKMQLNQPAASLDFFKAALSADQDEPKYWLSYVEALAEAGQKKAAVDTLMRGIEYGLHGDDVDRLVAHLTKPLPIKSQSSIVINGASHTQPQPLIPVNSLVDKVTKPATSVPLTMPTNVVNYSTQSNPAVVAPLNTRAQAQVPIEKKSKQSTDTASKPKGINAYLNNPQIKKMFALKDAGKIKEAKEQGLRLLKLFPGNPALLTCLGMIALEQGDSDAGVKYLEQSIAIAPDQTTALSYLSIAYTKMNRLTEALSYADKAITLNPLFAEGHANKGNAFHALKRYEEAVACYKKAIDLKPNDAVIKFNIGETFKVLKQYAEAATYLQQGLLLNPKDAAAQQACGDVLFELGRYSEALNCYNAAIKINKNNINALIGRGLTFIEVKEFESARADFAQAIHLNPNTENAHLNLGVALRYLSRYEEAFAANEIAIAQQKTNVQVYNNQALLLVDMQRFDEALDCYNKAIEVAPQFHETYWNKSLLHLLLGEYSQGWELYESRWESVFKKYTRHFSKPLWLGKESLVGKTILIYAEQGLGDDIQFCRYIADVEKLGAKVMLDVHKPLMTLIASLKGDFKIIESESELSGFDYHCPLMSLPYAFKTQLETIPATTPYLYANEEKAKDWEGKLGKKAKLRIGLAWSGSSAHKNDHNRSVPLELLTPLFSLPVEFHSLQKELRPADMHTLSKLDGLSTHQTALNDFSDTAALISQLDLVVTVDTSVAHLAGAMGKECWILLPSNPDFRWLLDRSDSPWYPSMTLFRQDKPLDWTAVIDRIKLKLQQEVEKC